MARTGLGALPLRMDFRGLRLLSVMAGLLLAGCGLFAPASSELAEVDGVSVGQSVPDIDQVHLPGAVLSAVDVCGKMTFPHQNAAVSCADKQNGLLVFRRGAFQYNVRVEGGRVRQIIRYNRNRYP